MDFRTKLQAAQQNNRSQLCIGLDIVFADSPLPMLVQDEPMLPFAREIIEATHDLVCAYKINPAYYLAEGAAGMVALERIVRLVPSHIPLIWDAKYAENSAVAASYARGAFEQYHADAVTLSGNLRPETLQHYLRYREQAIFLWNDDLSPALSFSDSMGIALDAVRWPRLSPVIMGTRDVLIFVETANHPNTGHDALLGMFKHAGDGLKPIVSVSRPILYASKRIDYVDVARAAAQKMRAAIND